jgi:transcriptional regulator with XRE-family HTH domain
LHDKQEKAGIMDDASIRNNMRKARESLGLSQSEMAMRLEMSLTAYHKLENGPTRIMNEHVVKFASITGMSLEKIVNGYEPIDSLEAGLDEVRSNYENTLKNLNDNYIKEIEMLKAENRRLNEKIQDKEELLQTARKLIAQYEKMGRK